MGFFYTDEGLSPKRLYIFMFIDTFKSFSLTFYYSFWMIA